MKKLDQEEKGFLASYNRDEWQSVSEVKSESERYRKLRQSYIQER